MTAKYVSQLRVTVSEPRVYFCRLPSSPGEDNPPLSIKKSLPQDLHRPSPFPSPQQQCEIAWRWKHFSLPLQTQQHAVCGTCCASAASNALGDLACYLWRPSGGREITTFLQRKPSASIARQVEVVHARAHTRTHMHTHTRTKHTHAHTHAHKHAHTRMYSYRHQLNKRLVQAPSTQAFSQQRRRRDVSQQRRYSEWRSTRQLVYPLFSRSDTHPPQLTEHGGDKRWGQVAAQALLALTSFGGWRRCVYIYLEKKKMLVNAQRTHLTCPYLPTRDPGTT